MPLHSPSCKLPCAVILCCQAMPRHCHHVSTANYGYIRYACAAAKPSPPLAACTLLPAQQLLPAATLPLRQLLPASTSLSQQLASSCYFTARANVSRLYKQTQNDSLAPIIKLPLISQKTVPVHLFVITWNH